MNLKYERKCTQFLNHKSNTKHQHWHVAGLTGLYFLHVAELALLSVPYVCALDTVTGAAFCSGFYLRTLKAASIIVFIAQLSLLKDILKEKHRGKVTKGVLFLHDNAPSHRALATQKKLAYLGFQLLDHPLYSPDLAPSDFHLFPGLKNQLKGRHFSSDAEVIADAESWLDGK